MPIYSSTLKVRFNVLEEARWQVLDAMPDVRDIVLSGLVPKRDAWVFFVRETGGNLTPYYFDAVREAIFPFAGTITTTRPVQRQLIGDGVKREIIVKHTFDWSVDALVWEKAKNGRLYQVTCDIFKDENALDQIGFAFSDPPQVEQFMVEIFPN
jgi:hypothetical protein